MAISDNIQAKADAIHQEWLEHQADPTKPTPIGDEVQSKAQAAIFGGTTNPDWTIYMSMFASNATELARLVPPVAAPDPDPERLRARAYLVSNGMCGMGTTDTIAENVGTTLDL